MVRQLKESSEEMTFFEHLDDLRPHLWRSAVAVLVIGIVAFCCKGLIIDHILFGPQSPDFPTSRFLCRLGELFARMCAWLGGLFGTEWYVDPTTLCINQQSFNTINTSLAGQFNLHLRVSLATAMVLGIPYLLWEFWQFVKPALTEREKAGTRMFVFYVSLCFFGGLLFGYFVIAPLSINFLANYNASEFITNMIDVNDYFSTVIGVSIACAVVFQLPLLIYFLTRIGIISSAFLKRYRRHALVVLAVIAGIITPPDIFSLVLVTLPLYGLYECSIAIAARVERHYREKEPVEAAS